MMQIIKFTDVDIDGNGTNVEVYIQVKGRFELTNGVIAEVKNKIENYKEECSGEYDTDSVINIACECLESKGYECRSLLPDYEIEF